MKTLKEKINSNQLVRAIGCNNPLGAKIAEKVGFESVWFSGFELATSMGIPDANILTMSDNLYFISAITRALKLPLIADCDSGFGNLNNVIHMVEAYERIGVSAVSIEDQIFPKLNSLYSSNQSLLSIDDFSAKIIGAKNARKSDEFLIFARMEAFIVGASMNEAIERAYSYEAAGADLLIVHSKKNDFSQIKEFCIQFKGKIAIGIIPTTYYQYTINELRALSPNINLVIYANYGIRSTISALQNTYKNILDNNSAKFCESSIASVAQAFIYQEMEKYQSNYIEYNNLAKKINKHD